MINLKQTIEKDRLQINHVERKIETVENEIAENLSKLLMEDKVANAGDEDDTVRVRALEDKINDMKSNFEEASSKKEWAEAKLLEIQA
jgi:DNA repair exonuclease SbcCD ATPase subunit